jgi:hypothetical protein
MAPVTTCLIGECGTGGKLKRGLCGTHYARIMKGGCCAVCGNTDTKALFLDRDPHTGAMRGVLCRTCNVGLKAFQEKLGLLHKAVEYLFRHKPRDLGPEPEKVDEDPSEAGDVLATIAAIERLEAEEDGVAGPR